MKLLQGSLLSLVAIIALCIICVIAILEHYSEAIVGVLCAAIGSLATHAGAQINAQMKAARLKKQIQRIAHSDTRQFSKPDED